MKRTLKLAVATHLLMWGVCHGAPKGVSGEEYSGGGGGSRGEAGLAGLGQGFEGGAGNEVVRDARACEAIVCVRYQLWTHRTHRGAVEEGCSPVCLS